MRTLATALLLTLLCSASAGAQTVRGVLVDDGSERPVVGALVVLLDSAGTQRGGSLTDQAGRFLIQAPVPGRYRLRAERVGYRSALSEPLELAAGAALEHPLRAPVEAVALEGIVARAEQRRCRVRPRDGERTQQVWEEARKALASAAFAESAGRYRLVVRQHERTLDPASLQVREETARERTVDRSPFVSAPVEQLVREGYVRAAAEGSGALEYFSPDASVLLSDAFLDTHCFALRAGAGEEEGLLGLAFEPVRRGSIPDVAGVLWLDPATAELRFLEHGYTGLEVTGARLARGRVEFDRSPNGGWIVRRWWIRAPLLGREAGRPLGTRVLALRERGGEVLEITTAGGAAAIARPPTRLQGTVFDSIAGRPLAGATVFLSGTSYSVTTDSEGAFRMEDVPEGTYAAGVMHPRLDSLRVVLPLREVSLARGQAVVANIAVPSLATVLAKGCPEPPSAPGRGVLVGVVTERESGATVPGARVVLAWDDPSGAARSLSTVADQEGRYRLCDAPAGASLRISAESRLHQGEAQAIRLAAGDATRVDLQPALRARVSATARGGAAQPTEGVSVHGRVLDAASGAPVAGAVVSLDGGEGGQVTDAQGTFRLRAREAGSHVLSVQHLGYRVESGRIELAAGVNEVEVRVPPRAVEVEGITVAVLSRTEMPERARTTARHAVAGAALRELDQRGARMEDLLRGRFPLVVRQVYRGGQPMPGVCVESRRGMTTITQLNDGGSSGAGCDMIQVVLDGVLVQDPGLFLRNLSLADFDSVELLSAIEAGLRWGSRSGSGVLVLTTRKP